MNTQVPWNLQWAQHVVAAASRVVLVARMTLTTQLALVMPSAVEFMEALVTWLVPEAPALQESQVVQLLPFRTSRGHHTLLGLLKALHLELQF
jgi:predicted small integral membrane protein